MTNNNYSVKHMSPPLLIKPMLQASVYICQSSLSDVLLNLSTCLFSRLDIQAGYIFTLFSSQTIRISKAFSWQAELPLHFITISTTFLLSVYQRTLRPSRRCSNNTCRSHDGFEHSPRGALNLLRLGPNSHEFCVTI